MKYYCKNCGSEIKTKFTQMKCPYCLAILQTMEVIPDYETPEQYEKRTGKAYPDEGAVWFGIVDDPTFNDWTLLIYADALEYEKDAEEADHEPVVFILIADPPVPPPKNWRPE